MLILLLGPSGVGKSTVGNRLSVSSEFLHLEIDQPGRDGIDEVALRPEWEEFLSNRHPEALKQEFDRRAGNGRCKGLVASFPSNLQIDLALLEASATVGLSPVILYGSATECLGSFLRREATNNRNLDADHWNRHNLGAHAFYGSAEFARFRVDVFRDNVHRDIDEITAEVLAKLQESLARKA